MTSRTTSAPTAGPYHVRVIGDSGRATWLDRRGLSKADAGAIVRDIMRDWTLGADGVALDVFDCMGRPVALAHFRVNA